MLQNQKKNQNSEWNTELMYQQYQYRQMKSRNVQTVMKLPVITDCGYMTSITTERH